MRRTISVLVAVISAAAVLSACGSATEPAAAKVGSETISRTTLDDQLSALMNNNRWMQSLRQSWGDELSAPEGGVSTRLSSAWLRTLMDQAIVDQAFEQRDLEVTDADRTAAKEAALGIFAGQETFDRFPKWFREDQLRRQERYAAVAATVPPRDPPTEERLQDYFSQVGQLLCASAEAVLEIKLDTPEAAEAIRTELAEGADFATLARERSQDEASGPNGGLAACTGTPQYDGLPEVMRQAVESLEIGGVSGVVPLNDGFNVFTLVPWTYEVARPILDEVYNDQLLPVMEEFVSIRLSRAKVWMDPRYGKATVSGARFTVEPPVPPTVKNDPPLTSSTTAPAGATSP